VKSASQRTDTRASAPPARSRSAPERAPRSAAASGTVAPAAGLTPAARDLLTTPGAGASLPAATRSSLERSFGTDLSGVRVHEDARSRSALGGLSARALAFGTHVFLGPRERASDLRVMGHEVAHVLQQRGGAETQRLALGGGDAYEVEAEHASVAVQRGATFAVSGRTGTRRPQPLWDWVKKGVSAVAGAIADLGSAALERALAFVRDHARALPGYDLLAFVLGRDPITQQAVERSAFNLLRALAGLVPGGQKLFDNLVRSNVVQRAYEWFSREVGSLGLTWATIRELFQKAWDALSVTDLLSPSKAWDKLKSIFGPPLIRLRDFAVAAGRKLLEFVFEGALALAGSAGQRVLGIFRKIGDTFQLIVADPIRFVKNLIDAVKGGFLQFGKNILGHLRNALFEWLTGALGGAITFPEKWDLKGIVSVILQILGLTYARLRGRLVKLVGERSVTFLEGAFDFLKVLVTQGLAAAWEKILEFATGLADQVIAGIRSFVIERIVAVAIPRIANLFQPAGAVIEACLAIYNTVMFVIEKAKQLAAFVESVVDSISNIARGNITAAVNYVERTLGRLLSLLVSFLARYIGLGNVAAKVQEVIKRIQGIVDGALDKVTEWIVKGAKALLDRMTGGAAGTSDSGPDAQAAARRRLSEGVRVGVSIANRFAGRKVGGAILKPLLAAVRIRYRLQSLEVVPKGGRWAVVGKVNPEEEAGTEAQIAPDADGSSAKPYPITWQKRPLKSYRKLWLAPQNKVAGRTAQGVLAKIAGAVEHAPWERKPLPGGGPEIGVMDRYQTRTALVVGPKKSSDRNPSIIAAFNALLEKHGYDRSEEPTDGDHVVELQVAGKDDPVNIWPLNSSENRAGGTRLNNFEITTQDGSVKKVADLPGKYFVIKKFAK
jgi:hypothetical protein